MGRTVGGGEEVRYFSTFTGIGGFEYGVDQVDPQAEHVGYSEIDKYACSVFEKHYPGVPNYGDITKINADELPDFDCLVGGFPCQAFSIAGKRRGFEDTRGTLFFDLARILKAKTPRLFVFENVKGLLSHDGGATFKTIIAAIDELGYDCQWQVLNSKNHGVPQNRERIIIVGHLRGTPRPEVFPFSDTDGEDTRIVGQDVAYTIDASYHKGTNTLAKSRRSVVAFNRKEGVGKELENAMTINAGDYRGLNRNQSQNAVIEDLAIRRLTPIECERLQAFPDNWTKYGVTKDYIPDDTRVEVHMTHCNDGEENEDSCKYGQHDTCPALNKTAFLVSDTQRYKMCGNAVTTNVIRDVFERILA